jgi:nitrite reductase/ring-hydroxylating ferredoxin subunit
LTKRSSNEGEGEEARVADSARAKTSEPGHGPEGESVLGRDAFTPIRIHRDARQIGEGGAIRFSIVLDGISRDAFAARWRGRLYAYLNTCRHEALALDFGDAHFFDEPYDALVCCHHGARYRPDDGVCVAGPCEGARLTPLVLEERGGELWCRGRG